MESVSNLGEGIWIIFATSKTRFPPILFATFQTKVSWVQYSDGFFLRPRRQASPNSFCNLMRQDAAMQTMHTPYSHTANRKNIFYSSQISPTKTNQHFQCEWYLLSLNGETKILNETETKTFFPRPNSPKPILFSDTETETFKNLTKVLKPKCQSLPAMHRNLW